jgi:peroxiredoxin
MVCSFVPVTKPITTNCRQKKKSTVQWGRRWGTYVPSTSGSFLQCNRWNNHKQNFRPQRQLFHCVLEDFNTWMCNLKSYVEDNTRKIWRQSKIEGQQQKESQTPEKSTFYLQKQLLKGQLESILRDLYVYPHSFKVGKELSPKISRNITVSHPLLERIGFPSSIRIPKTMFLLFISSLGILKKWMRIDDVHMENLEYCSPEEAQLVARFHLTWAVKNRKLEYVVFLRLTLDSNGDIKGWQERWSDTVLDSSRATISKAAGNRLYRSEANQAHNSNYITQLSNGESFDFSVIQKNLLNAYVRKKTHIQRSEWYHARVNKIIHWSKEQMPRLFTSAVDLSDIYSEFVELENPFVIAFGISAVQKVHQSIRLLTKVLFERVDCSLVSVVHPNPETVIALYRIYGKGRFLGGRVQYLSRNTMTIDLDGKIVRHQETWNVERNQIVKMWLSSE